MHPTLRIEKLNNRLAQLQSSCQSELCSKSKCLDCSVLKDQIEDLFNQLECNTFISCNPKEVGMGIEFCKTCKKHK